MVTITLSQPSVPILPLTGLPAWLCGLLAARGVTTAEAAQSFLHPAADQLRDPLALHDLEQAVAIIRNAAAQGRRAVVYGDYDVDGVSASAILYETLGILGMARQVYLPDRHKEGYGLNIPAVEKLAQEADILITVDCGITSIAEVSRAKELGMTVVVTDHHRHLDTLPPADAVVSPLLGDYPFPGLCGAGVAWKLALALAGEQVMELMELAAVATVADMVPLTDENRVIAALGLEQLAHTKRPGLRAVMERAGVQGTVSSDQVGFQIAPRMNACGRMASARIAFDMLTTRDRGEAEELAARMEALNQERKAEENKVLEAALSQAAQMDLVENHAIVVWGEGWNSGVVGLAAGRVAEQFAYPTVALAVDGDKCVGSARSAGDIDIYKALSQCADLFERFGGHKQAAGLTLKRENLEIFAKRLSQAVAEQTGGKPVKPALVCDGKALRHGQSRAALSVRGRAGIIPSGGRRGGAAPEMQLPAGKRAAGWHLFRRRGLGWKNRGTVPFRLLPHTERISGQGQCGMPGVCPANDTRITDQRRGPGSPGPLFRASFRCFCPYPLPCRAARGRARDCFLISSEFFGVNSNSAFSTIKSSFSQREVR